MTFLLYTNNEFLLCEIEYDISRIIQLNKMFPNLDNIFPKYIDSGLLYYHFILDINNNLHIVDTNGCEIEFYENVLQPSMTNPIMIRSTYLAYCGKFPSSSLLNSFSDAQDSCPVISFLSFDNIDGKFIIESFEIIDSINKIYSSIETKLYNIKKYEFVDYNNIILITNNNETYIYINERSEFELFNNIDYHLYINDNIYIKKNNKLFSTNVDYFTDKNIRTLKEKSICSTMPVNNKYLYCHNYTTVSIQPDISNGIFLNENQFIENTKNFICIIGIHEYALCIFNNKIVSVDLETGDIDRLYIQLPFKLTDELIAHSINFKFVWTKKNHHYLSFTKKEIIKMIIMNNKYTIFHKIPFCVLSIIINMIIW